MVVHGAAVINNFILTSTWMTVAMSFSRYMAVCHPLSAYHNLQLSVDSNDEGCRHSGTRFKAGVIFVASFLFNLPRFFRNRVESHVCRLSPGAGVQTTVFALNFGSSADHNLMSDFAPEVAKYPPPLKKNQMTQNGDLDAR